MGRSAIDIHRQLGAVAHQLFFPGVHHAPRKSRPQVQAEHGFDLAALQNPRGADGLGAPGGLLPGLEDQQHIVGQCLLFAQAARQLQQDCHVTVMAAGVHPAGMPGGEGKIGLLCNGQRVHIGTKGDGIVRAEVKKGTDPVLHGRKHPAVQPLQCPADIGCGFWQLQLQLRDGVQRLPVTNYLQHMHCSLCFF